MIARRIAPLLFVFFGLSACSNGDSAAPDALAFADQPETPSVSLALDPVQDTNIMRFAINGERFELTAGICNTYDDGTFRFSLAQGELDDGGSVTATIERFDTGTSFDVLIALEGLRANTTSVTWYAEDPAAIHDMRATVIGPEIRGTALFTEVEDVLSGNTAPGEFSLRCAPAAG